MTLATDPFFPLLKTAVIRATGMEFFADKDADLAAVIGRRLETVGAADCAQYYDLVVDPERGWSEREELVNELTIGETYFFRHPELFEALRNTVLPDVIARNAARRRLRIWSAGCATGAEPYSLAILLRRDFADALAGWHVQIVGTDINKRFLTAARRGTYQNWALRATSEADRERYFLPTEDGAWTLKAQYREGVSFRAHNLIADRFPSVVDDLCDFDVILCRNVLIYFSRQTVRKVVAGLYDCLGEGGWLLPGHAEPDMELFRDFHTVNAPGAVVYQKGAAGWRPVETATDAEEPVQPAAAEPPPLPLPAAAPASVEALVAAPAAGGGIDALRDLVDRGEWRRASAVAAAIAADHPDSPALFLYLGLAQQALGRGAEARSSLQRAVFLDRRFALAHYCLGVLLRGAGDRGAARAFANAAALCAKLPPHAAVPCGDGLTYGRLVELADTQRRAAEVL